MTNCFEFRTALEAVRMSRTDFVALLGVERSTVWLSTPEGICSGEQHGDENCDSHAVPKRYIFTDKRRDERDS